MPPDEEKEKDQRDLFEPAPVISFEISWTEDPTEDPAKPNLYFMGLPMRFWAKTIAYSQKYGVSAADIAAVCAAAQQVK